MWQPVLGGLVADFHAGLCLGWLAPLRCLITAMVDVCVHVVKPRRQTYASVAPYVSLPTSPRALRSVAITLRSCAAVAPPTLADPWSFLRRVVLTALGMRLDGDVVTAMVDPLTALLQVGLPEGPQLQPKPHRKWHRGGQCWGEILKIGAQMHIFRSSFKFRSHSLTFPL